jgi:hypothetical protein
MTSIDSKYLNHLILQELVSVISEQSERGTKLGSIEKQNTKIDDWIKTYRTYIKTTDDGNKFRAWVHDSGNYPKLQAEMNRRVWRDNTLSRKGNITSDHFKLAWRMFHNEYLKRENTDNIAAVGPGTDSWYNLEDDPTKSVSTDAVMDPRTQWASATSSGTRNKPRTELGPIAKLAKNTSEWLDELGDDFKDTKFYMFLKQVQYDIEGDINSIKNPNSEKRRKMRRDFERFENWAMGYWSCWTGPDGWDCFINDPDLGIRPKLYSGTGIAATIFADLFPPTAIAARVLFALLLADDIKRLSEGDYAFSVFLDLLIDSVCVLAGGAGNLATKGLKAVTKPVSKFATALFEGSVRGFTGATSREIAQMIKYYRGIGMAGESVAAKAMREIYALLKKIDPTKLLSSTLEGFNALKNSASKYLNSIINSPLIPDAVKSAAQGVKTLIVSTIQTITKSIQLVVGGIRLMIKVIGGLITGAPLSKLLEYLGVSTKYARAFGAATSAIGIGFAFEKYAEHQKKMAEDEQYRKIEEMRAQTALEAGQIQELQWGYLKPYPDQLSVDDLYVPMWSFKAGQTGPEIIQGAFGPRPEYTIEDSNNDWPIPIQKTKISIIDTSADGKYKKIVLYGLKDALENGEGMFWVPVECAELTGHWDR